MVDAPPPPLNPGRMMWMVHFKRRDFEIVVSAAKSLEQRTADFIYDAIMEKAVRTIGENEDE
jgi:hypothetical protein